MTHYYPVLTAAPAVLPVSVDEVKLHLRIDHADEDTILALYLQAVVGHLDGASGWLGRSIIAQTWSQQFDAFAPEIELGLVPVSSIGSVTYLDADGVTQTVAPSSYSLINGGTSPVVRFSDDFSVPTVTDDEPVVTITFLSGYGDEEDAPAPIKAAILLMTGDLYQNREAKLASGQIENSTVRRLLDPYRTVWAA